MNTITIVNQLLLSAHLVGLIGSLVCLVLLYWNIPRVFLPSLGGWSSFRLTRLLGMLTRSCWLTWLSGLALMMVGTGSVSQTFMMPVYRDKLLLLFLLSISGVGLELLVRRAYMARESDVYFIRGVADGLWIRFALALSLAVFCALVYLLFGYVTGSYATAMMTLVGVLAGCLGLAFFLLIDDRWLNGYTSLTSSRFGG